MALSTATLSEGTDSRMSYDSDHSNACTPNVKGQSSLTTDQAGGDASDDFAASRNKLQQLITKSQEIRRQLQTLDQGKRDLEKRLCPVRKSWVELMEEEDGENEQQDPQIDEPTTLNNESNAVSYDRSPRLLPTEKSSRMSLLEVPCSTNTTDHPDSAAHRRQIEIDILDSANVKKYDKLVQSEKIKSPFKRRISGEQCEEEEELNDANQRDDNDDESWHDHQRRRRGEGGPSTNKRSKKDEHDHGAADIERFRCESSSSGSSVGGAGGRRQPAELETDLAILERRQKQIDYGKNTLGYENYLQQVPRDKRTKDHPKTPPKHLKYSRRAWDGLVKVWRKKLHCFDPDGERSNPINEDK